MNSKIKLVQQTLPNNCVSACIAMVTGFDIEKVTAEFHQEYCDNTAITEYTYLQNIGYECKLLDALFRQPKEGFIYIAIVPSLNIQGGSHAVVIQYSEDDGFIIHDPNKGREGKLYYVNGVKDSDLAFQLISYQCCVEISEQYFAEFTNSQKQSGLQ